MVKNDWVEKSFEEKRFLKHNQFDSGENLQSLNIRINRESNFLLDDSIFIILFFHILRTPSQIEVFCNDGKC